MDTQPSIWSKKTGQQAHVTPQMITGSTTEQRDVQEMADSIHDTQISVDARRQKEHVRRTWKALLNDKCHVRIPEQNGGIDDEQDAKPLETL